MSTEPGIFSDHCFSHNSLLFATLRLCVFALICCCPLFAQRIAVLTPETNDVTQKYAADLTEHLSTKYNILDSSLSETAFRSVNVENAFNMNTKQSKAVASVIGSDYFLLVKSGTLRRSSFEKPEYYEAFNTTYAVSGRTGRLVFWDLKSFESNTPVEAERLLLNSAKVLAAEIRKRLENVHKAELSEKVDLAFEEVPPDDSPLAKNFRPPLPYKRIKPEYTRTAYLYGIRATVDVSVDIDAAGAIIRTEIERWAGFGLDESVIDAVRKMNWRPATRNSKTLPMRVLLRYNFRKHYPQINTDGH